MIEANKVFEMEYDGQRNNDIPFFYSFNVVTNIHEISGHYYVRFEKLINPKKENILDSPNIDTMGFDKELLLGKFIFS